MISYQQRTGSNKKITNLLSRYQQSFSMTFVLTLALVFLSGCSGLVSQKSDQHSISSSLASFLNSGGKSKEFQSLE